MKTNEAELIPWASCGLLPISMHAECRAELDDKVLEWLHLWNYTYGHKIAIKWNRIKLLQSIAFSLNSIYTQRTSNSRNAHKTTYTI